MYTLVPRLVALFFVLVRIEAQLLRIKERGQGARVWLRWTKIAILDGALEHGSSVTNRPRQVITRKHKRSAFNIDSLSTPQSLSACPVLVTNKGNLTKSHNNAPHLPVHPCPSPLPSAPSNYSSLVPGDPASGEAPGKHVQHHPTCCLSLVLAVVRMTGRNSPGIPPAGVGFGLGQQRTRRCQAGIWSSSSRQTRALHQCPLVVPTVMTRPTLLASWKKCDGRHAWTCHAKSDISERTKTVIQRANKGLKRLGNMKHIQTRSGDSRRYFDFRKSRLVSTS
ncbi:hypothetical protein LA080_008294 [Diaporthe eres]|nr:hypothetical protein LA080_008294 [Diaporthe eres]